MSTLSDVLYGKANIRVARTFRLADKHVFKEFTVMVLLGGKRLEDTYLTGDNKDVIPTDTIKNTVFVMANEHDLNSPEAFAQHIANHFFSMYKTVENVKIEVKEHAWERINAGPGGSPHPHAFVKGGPEVRFALLTQQRSGVALVQGGFEGLSVLKTCGSAFKDFHRDKFTTLGDASDRLLATSVLCRYDFGNGVGAHKNASAVYAAVKHLVLEMFAREFSYSVQETLYKMGVRALKELPQLESIYFEMPNIHIFAYPPIEKSFGLKNNETMIAYTDPNGLIVGRVSRSAAKL